MQRMSLLTYYPAVLKINGRWYVEFYQTNPSTGEKKRFREYHNLNRIPDLNERRKAGLSLVKMLNEELLPHGYPYVKVSASDSFMNLQDAITLCMSIKKRSDRPKTVSTYQTVVNYFEEYIKLKNIEYISVKTFGQKEAMSFMDYINDLKKPAPRTYNNYLAFMKSLFGELVDRGHIQKNPWSTIKKSKIVEKSRRMLDDYELKKIFEAAYASDKMLTLCIFLLYYCFIRPGEQRLMKVHMIDLRNGLIHLPGSITKNKKSETVTIPSVMIPYFEQIKFDEWYHEDYIFGKGCLPHPDKPCGANTLGEKHRTLINNLYKSKVLRTKKGIELYSWKDTGAMALVKSGIDAYELMKQMRHSDLSTTQKYLNSLENVNKNVQNFSGNLVLPTK